MKKTRNEIKERNGKIIFIVVVLSPIVIFVGYFIWSFYIMNQFTESIHRTVEKMNEQRSINLKTQNEIINYPEFMENKRSLFLGGRIEDDIQFVNGIEFQSIDSFSIRYKIDYLENWKTKKEIEGIAKLDKESIINDSFSFKDRLGEFRAAYRLIDSTKKCELEILISKGKYQNSSISIVREDCGTDKKEITEIMYYK